MRKQLTGLAQKLGSLKGPMGLTLTKEGQQTFRLVDEWGERAKALQRMAPYVAAQVLYAGLMARIPGDPAWVSYRRSITIASVGSKDDAGYVVRVQSGSGHVIQPQQEVLYIQPRKGRLVPLPPEVAILAKYNPWTLGMLPFSPKKNEATIVTRRASAREIKSVELQRKKDKPLWSKEMAAVGVRVAHRTEPLTQVDVPVVSDLAFAGFRLEFGFGGLKRTPHWRPSIAEAAQAVRELFSKKSIYTDIMTAPPGASGWKRWPPKVGQRLAAGDLKAFSKFQKRLGVQL